MGTFALDLAKFADKVKVRADAVTGDVVAQIASALDLRSPVGDASYWVTKPLPGYVGGRFRGNWQLGVNSSPGGETGVVDPNGSAAYPSIVAAIPEEASGKVYFIVNNVPYANRIEDGWSRQAPSGLVGLTAIEFPQMVDQAVASLPGVSLVLIRSALEVALAAMTPSVQTAYENAPFTPVAGTPYQRVFLLAAAPDNPEMGRFTRDQGILQVSLAYPLNAGPAAATARAELIRDTFYRGRSFTSGGLTTVIERTPEIAPGRVEEDRFVIPVRIRFFANYVA